MATLGHSRRLKLTPARNKSLMVELEARGFEMPGLAATSATAIA